MLKQTKLIENIKRIGIICILWIFCMFFYYLIIYFTVDEVDPDRIEFDAQFIMTGIILGLLFGLTNGFLEIFIFRHRFKRLKFGYTVLLKTNLFIATFIATVIVFILIKNYLLAPAGLLEKANENELTEFFRIIRFLQARTFCRPFQLWN